LVWDGSGLVLYWKRLEQGGRFYQRVIFLVLEIRGHDTSC
jgi:hypothetical protein